MTDEQYRISRRTAHGDLEIVATCGTKEAIGVALVTLGEEGEFDGCTVGVLHKPFEDKPGTWIVNPFPAIPRSGDTASGKKSRQSEKSRKGKR